MTMYLPNPDLHPTGYEPAEFIEPPGWPTTGDTVPRSDEDNRASRSDSGVVGETATGETTHRSTVTSARPAAS